MFFAKLRCSWPILVLLLAGCVQVPTPLQRMAEMDDYARRGGWEALGLDAGLFVLRSYVPARIDAKDGLLTVYIEGDGYAWVTPTMPSSDPTPTRSMVLRLATSHPEGAVAYLARPCQYVAGADWRGCDSRYWRRERFSLAVVEASDRALTQLKDRFGAERLRLVGYSGGGVVAALLAARRNDVELLVTVAANLDLHAWSKVTATSPLTHSLNPVDYAPALSRIAQIHYVGGRDRTVPLSVVLAYRATLAADTPLRLELEPSNGHVCCWELGWAERVRSWRVPEPGVGRRSAPIP